MRYTLFFTSAFSIILFLSCSKSSSSANQTSPKDSIFIACTIDGVPLTFNFRDTAYVNNTTFNGKPSEIYILQGFQTYTPYDTPLLDSAGILEMAIVVNAGTQAQTGTYSESDTSYFVDCYYKKFDYQATYEGGTAAYDSGLVYHTSIVNPFSITVSSITDTTISGSFSGDVFMGLNPIYPKVTITGGKFYLKIY